MRPFGIVGVVAGLLVASAAGRDAIPIKIAYPKSGDKVKVTVEEKRDGKLKFVAEGKEEVKNEVKTKSLVYVDEVVEGDGVSRRPKKVRRTYEKAAVGTGGEPKSLPVEGKTVLIEKRDDKYTFSIDGKPADGELQKLLEGEFGGKADKHDPRDLMLPKEGVKAGGEWKIPGDKLADAFGELGFKLDRSKLVATGKLVKAEKRDGKQFGTIELAIAAPITDLGPKLKITEGSLSLSMTGDGVIDGSSSKGATKKEMRFKVSGSGDGFDLVVDETTTETRTVEPLK